jgi:G3E family GTPase
MEPERTRLVLLGGFLGAGKSTALARAAREMADRGLRVGVITNDQAEGLVDTALFQQRGLPTREVAGGCFCCRFDDFMARADALLAEARPDVLLAEPVGSCTDLVETVLRPVARLHGRRFSVSPFVVLVDPLRALRLLGGDAPTGFSEKITYIFRLQQQEADLLALSKVDLLDADTRGRVRALLSERFPDAEILETSAATGEGFDALFERWLGGEAPRRRTPEVDYDVYAAGEAELGWLNADATLHADGAIDVDRALLELARELGSELRARGLEVAHAKLLLRGERNTAIANLVHGDVAAVLSQSADEAASELSLVANVRARGDPEDLRQAFQAALERWQALHRAVARIGSIHALSPSRPVPTHLPELRNSSSPRPRNAS